MPADGADVVIIGGGVMGCASARCLAEIAGPRALRIVVIERDQSYRACATTRSVGGLRQQFSTPECIAMSQVTLDLVRRLAAEHGPQAGLGFREQGYLLLAGSAAAASILRDNVAVQHGMGADVVALSDADLARKFPWLDPRGVALGSLGVSGEGWLDPALLLQYLKDEARALGVAFVTDTVIGLERAGKRIAAVHLASGQRLAAAHVVNAGGPQAGAIARMAGIDLPVEPRKRFVFVFDCRDASADLNAAPLTVDPSGVWFRPEGRQFICGLSPANDADEPDPGDLDDIDHGLFEARIWPVLAARVPAFAAIKSTGAWAGHYDYNVVDQNAVIGPHDGIPNLHFCCGFSGHGLQHAVAAGRAVAEQIAHGRYLSLDLSRLGYDRLRRRAPLIERNVF